MTRNGEVLAARRRVAAWVTAVARRDPVGVGGGGLVAYALWRIVSRLSSPAPCGVRPARRGVSGLEGEPIPGRGWEDEERPRLRPDGGLPAPVEPPLAPSVPAALRGTEDAPGADAQGSIATDRAALEALYDTTDGPNWTDSTNWKTDAPLGEWSGVRTDTDGRVTEIWLIYSGLAGPLPHALEALSRLRVLHLQGNTLTGPIPAWLGNLTNLRLLYFNGQRVYRPAPFGVGREDAAHAPCCCRRPADHRFPGCCRRRAVLRCQHVRLRGTIRYPGVVHAAT